MFGVVGVGFLALLVTLSWHHGNCQLFSTSHEATVDSISQEIASDILTITIDGTVNVVGDCSNSQDASRTQFWLYTRKNPNHEIIVTSCDQIDSSKPTIILIHGWGGNANVDYIRVITDAYLKQYDCNIISVDYSAYVAIKYSTAFCYVPAVAQVVADFIYNMSSQCGISTKKLHVVGHSLGAQVAGVAGHKIQERKLIIKRITGLDPAGPLFQGIDKNRRLSETSAELVDVIHTNQGRFGYVGNCGTVDFYPNGGFLQPGCIVHTMESFALGKLRKIPLTFINCNHQRSCYLFAESITNNAFHSFGCSLYIPPLICMNKDYTYMGESCRWQPLRAKYQVTTNSNPPYAKGPRGGLNILN